MHVSIDLSMQREGGRGRERDAEYIDIINKTIYVFVNIRIFKYIIQNILNIF